MPELPDITVYLDALQTRVAGCRLETIRIKSPFLLRTVTPRAGDLEGRSVVDLRRLGKRICIGLEGDSWIVLHLMIAGRLHWSEETGAKIPGGRNGLVAFDFGNGSLSLTEAGSKKRASLHFIDGEEGLRELDPGGLEVVDIEFESFRERLNSASHTLKRALTDPRLFSGIGNAYSDEILHRARLSPVALTRSLEDEETRRLHTAVIETLTDWIARLRAHYGETFPEGVTAFRPEMAVHGKFGQACPVCRTPVQRIRYAANETNYCPTCQTGGCVLADRALSRLLKQDWPRSVDELERLPQRH